MTKYKVGDVAALFSKPKNPTSAAGKKLQSLFEDYYSKKDKFAFQSQEKNSDINIKEEKGMNDQSASKKGKKRKFSSFEDTEINENVSVKKFNKPSNQEVSVSSENKKHKKAKREKYLSQCNINDSALSNNVSPKKFQESPESSKTKKDRKFKNHNFSNNSDNGSEFNNNVFSKKFKQSPENFENNKIEKLNKFKKQQDFPRKNKHPDLSLFSTSSAFSDLEAKDVSKSVLELKKEKSSPLKNMPKDIKKNKSFIKKSKKQSLNHNSSKLSTDVSHKDSYDSDDNSLKKEIEEFIHNNSEENEMDSKKGKAKQGKSFNWKEHDTTGKPKKKFLQNQNSFFEKYEESSEQGVKSKKMNKKNNDYQQAFPRNKKESKSNSFSFENTKSEIEYDDVEENSPSKKKNPVEQDHVKKSKKSKHRFNETHGNSLVTSDNNSEHITPKTKEAVNFIRKPKNKKDEGDNVSSGIQNLQVKGETLESIRLHNFAEENDVKNPEERLSRTLFVGNLPKHTSKQEVKNLFTVFGKIESIRLTGVETDKAKIFGKNPPKLLHSNYASDTVPGFVVFQEKESAVEALKLSGCVFKNHHITVDFALPAGTHKIYDDKRSIFIGNLPFDVKDESVWNALAHCGRIEGVRVVRDRNSGLGKGFGYVLFSTVESKENAMALEKLNIEGREVRIKAVDSNKKVKKSGPPPTKRDSFKSRAIRLKKKGNATGGHKSIRKLTNKQKNLHNKKKISAILQKAMK